MSPPSSVLVVVVVVVLDLVSPLPQPGQLANNRIVLNDLAQWAGVNSKMPADTKTVTRLPTTFAPGAGVLFQRKQIEHDYDDDDDDDESFGDCGS